MKVSILGVTIDRVTLPEVRRRIGEFLEGQGSHTIVTPNPEFLVAATQSADFRDTLNQADLAIPDGVGLLFAARILQQRLPNRVTGVEAAEIIAEEAARLNKSIFLLGGEEGIAKSAAAVLKKKYPRLNIVGTESGGKIEIANSKWQIAKSTVIEQIQITRPDILLVALGHVKQELWIRDHLHFFPSVKIAMGIGGTLDYLAGAVPVPPRVICSIGLEWLWRLATQPWRARRIFTATIHFSWLVLKERFRL